jgi:FlaA1/EpsC-like NDP-sugar epimerase
MRTDSDRDGEQDLRSGLPEQPAMRVLVGLVRRLRFAHRGGVAMSAYGGIAATSYLLAYLLRFEFPIPEAYATTFLVTLPLIVGIRLVCARFFKLSTTRWRYAGISDVMRLATATAAGTVGFLLISGLLPLATSIPLSIILAEGLFTAAATAAVWTGYRASFEHLKSRQHDGLERKRALIVGAGEAGSMLAREMRRLATGYWPVGYVDDDPRMWGTRLDGLEVIGSPQDLPAIATSLQVQEIIIAVPSAAPEQLRRLVELSEQAGLPCKVLPGIASVFHGNVRVNQLRDVQIEDLLGRDPVELELPELADDIEGRCVLITGAAGSIGSELARQVALHRPATLVILDHAETELFYLELELRENHPELRLEVVIGDVVDRGAVDRVFRRCAPDHVYHAAAYKHVPMMEGNLREAIRNNVCGTQIIAEAAGRHGALKFLLVSTDKAVRPSSVMGASKRLAEMVVIELQNNHPETSYGAVRFGNVLGSNGSVIPIFKRQLAAGKPLTVTHPDTTRYFMTIPEAVQLILQASLLPELRGSIAMLEMGEPVRIADLAHNLLRLSGIDGRNGDRVVYTGLRPGEKLHEELVAPDEQSRETPIAKVRIVSSTPRPVHLTRLLLPKWEAALEEGRDEWVAASLQELFPGLSPHTLTDRVLPRNAAGSRGSEALSLTSPSR